MEQPKKNIPDYATKLRNFEADETPEVWNGVASGVRKKLFLKFRWNYFNVYYLIVAISAVVITIALLFTNKIYTKKESKSAGFIDTTKNNLQLQVTLENENDSQPNNEVKVIVKTRKENSSLPPGSMNIPARDKAELQVSPVLKEQQADSLQIVKSKIDSVKPVIKKTPVVIRKRDTIVDIDTIKTYKKKRRR